MKRKYFFVMDSAWVDLKLLLVIMLLLGFNGFGQTCDSSQCTCEKGDLNPSGIMIGYNHPKGTWMFSYRYMNMQLKNNLSGTQKVSDDVVFQNYIMAPYSMNMGMHMIMAMYGFTDRFSFMTMFNYNVVNMKMNMLPGTSTTQMNGMTMTDLTSTSMVAKSKGLGDIKLFAMYSLISNSRHQLMLSAGINLPTGNIKLCGSSTDMIYSSQRLPYTLQLGSGTYDVLPGITYQLKGICFTWGTQVSGVYRSSYNSLGYCYGNETMATTWFAYRFLPWLSGSVRAEGQVVGNMYGKDQGLYQVLEPDAKPANYGGQKINAYTGINFFLRNFANSKLSVEFGLPIYQNVNGVQLGINSILFTEWTVSF
jgi:hypothetical protein